MMQCKTCESFTFCKEANNIFWISTLKSQRCDFISLLFRGRIIYVKNTVQSKKSEFCDIWLEFLRVVDSSVPLSSNEVSRVTSSKFKLTHFKECALGQKPVFLIWHLLKIGPGKTSLQDKNVDFSTLPQKNIKWGTFVRATFILLSSLESLAQSVFSGQICQGNLKFVEHFVPILNNRK